VVLHWCCPAQGFHGEAVINPVMAAATSNFFVFCSYIMVFVALRRRLFAAALRASG